jgi:transporter family protein
MSWILFSLLAALTWAVVDTIDKHVLTKWTKRPAVPLMLLGIVGVIAAIAVYLFRGFQQLSAANIMLSFLAGILYFAAMLFYFRAVKLEEISRVVPLFNLTHFFVLVLAAVFLGEIFTPLKYVGVFLLIIGAVLISMKQHLALGKSFWLMILTSLCLAFNSIISKYVLNFADFWTVFSYSRIGTLFILVPLFCFYARDLKEVRQKHGAKVIFYITLNESLSLAGVFFITIAASIGFITLVQALSAVQPFFVLLFAVILSIFFPKFLKEKISRPVLLLKFIATVMIFAGAVLIV